MFLLVPKRCSENCHNNAQSHAFCSNTTPPFKNAIYTVTVLSFFAVQYILIMMVSNNTGIHKRIERMYLWRLSLSAIPKREHQSGTRQLEQGKWPLISLNLEWNINH